MERVARDMDARLDAFVHATVAATCGNNMLYTSKGGLGLQRYYFLTSPEVLCFHMFPCKTALHNSSKSTSLYGKTSQKRNASKLHSA